MPSTRRPFAEQARHSHRPPAQLTDEARGRAKRFYAAAQKAGIAQDGSLLTDAVLRLALDWPDGGVEETANVVKAIRRRMYLLRQQPRKMLLEYVPWSGRERFPRRVAAGLRLEAEAREMGMDTLRAAASLLRGREAGVAALVQAALLEIKDRDLVAALREQLDTLVVATMESATVRPAPSPPVLLTHPNAQVFYDGHVEMLRRTALAFYRELHDHCPTCSEAQALTPNVAVAIRHGASFPLRDAALRVAGSVPRLITRLAGRGGSAEKRHASSSQVVRVDIRCGGYSATDVYYRGVGAGLNRDIAEAMVPRTPSRSALPNAPLSLAELVAWAERSAGESTAHDTECVVADLFDERYLRLLYDPKTRAGWAAAAFAGDVVGRHEATIKRLKPKEATAGTWAAFVLPVLKIAALGTMEDPFWASMLQKACRHTGWLSALRGSGSLSASST
jgi:hypothetical protein